MRNMYVCDGNPALALPLAQARRRVWRACLFSPPPEDLHIFSRLPSPTLLQYPVRIFPGGSLPVCHLHYYYILSPSVAYPERIRAKRACPFSCCRTRVRHGGADSSGGAAPPTSRAQESLPRLAPGTFSFHAFSTASVFSFAHILLNNARGVGGPMFFHAEARFPSTARAPYFCLSLCVRMGLPATPVFFFHSVHQRLFRSSFGGIVWTLPT